MKETTRRIPNVPLVKSKRTKIIATVGPATNSYKAIHEMIRAGVNGVRMNFSHGTYAERERQIDWVRRAAREYGKPVAVIQDLQGPKMRLGDFEGVIQVTRGQRLVFGYKADYDAGKVIPTQFDLARKVRRGERIFLYDGRIRSTVTGLKDGLVTARAENGGVLMQRKGINLPDTDFGGDIITAKDRKDLRFGSTQDIDYVALSFVQTAEDIAKLRRLLRGLGSRARIIAKVETNAAVAHIEQIVQEADAVMVARGDLAIETSPESVPIVQRRIIGLGRRYSTPTIVATQMLASMMETPEPTRAEVSDIATAVILGVDSVMLSDETANGQYPIEAVQVMKRVILYAQDNIPVKAVFPDGGDPSRQRAITAAVVDLARTLQAKAIVAETKSGATALHTASLRPDRPVIAVTSDPTVANQLAIVFGVKSFVRPDDRLAATRLIGWLSRNKVLSPGDVVVTASGQHPGVVGATDTIKVRMVE